MKGPTHSLQSESAANSVVTTVGQFALSSSLAITTVTDAVEGWSTQGKAQLSAKSDENER